MKTIKIITTQDIRSLPDMKESFLNRANLRIFSASSNKEVLDIHRIEKADLIIANLDDSIMNGELLCSLIREDKELQKVSLIIMHSRGNTSIKCRANAFIDLSDDPAILLLKAHQLLNIPTRETFRAPIFVKIMQDPNIDLSLGYSENISITGMLFDSDKTIFKGEIILCNFVLPDSMHIRTEAEVVRYSDKGAESATNQYGVRFIKLSEKFKNAIESYIRQKQQKS